MNRPIHLLLVEDSADDAELNLHSLRRAGFHPIWKRVETAGGLRAALEAGAWDAVLSDFTLPGFGAAEALEIVRSVDVDLPFIVVSGTVGEDRAVAMMRAGANDYLLKDSLVRLAPLLEREVRETVSRRAHRNAEREAQLLAAVVESSEDPIVSTDLNGVVQTWNPAAQRLFGYTAAEIIGTSGLLVPPELLEEVRGMDQRLRLGELILPFDTVRLKKGGEPIEVSLTLSAVRVGGEIVAKAIVYRDIAKRKRIEKTQALLAAVVESSEDAMLCTDLDGRIQSWNGAAERLFGYTFEEVVGTADWILPPALIAEARERDDRLSRGEQIPPFESVRLRKGGDPVAVSITLSPVRVGGRVVSKSAVYRDITERNRIQDDLRAREARYRALVENSWDGVTMIDAIGTILYASSASTRALGFPHDEYVGRNGGEFVHPDDQLMIGEAFTRLAAKPGGATTYTYRHLHKDGSWRIVETVATNLLADPDLRAFVLNSRDVTDRVQAEQDIRKSEEELSKQSRILKSILDNMSEGVVVADEQGKFVLFNPAAEQILLQGESDAPPEEWSARYSLFQTDGHSPVPTADIPLVRALAGESVDEAEMIVNHAHLPVGVRISVNARPLRDASGALRGGIAVFHDITEKTRAREALTASERRYRTLVVASAAIVWDSPASGEFDSEQPAWSAFTGQTLEEHRHWGWLNAIHPDDQEKSAQAWTAAMRNRCTYEVEHRLRRFDSEYRQMFVRAVPIFDDCGTLREWVGVHTDVTDQRRLEVERAELLTQLTLQIERMPLAYLLSGPDFRYTRWNPAAERMFGFSEIEALGKHPFETIVPSQSEPFVTELFARLAVGDMNAHGFSENVRKDGTVVYCEWHNTPLFGPGDVFQGILSLAQDVTARRSLEEQFRHVQKMEAVGLLAAGVAHDFNNLLTVINGYSDLLLQELETEDPSWELLDEIRKAGERAAGLTRQLLAFSRQQVLAPRVLDLNVVVNDTEKMLRRLIGEDVRLSCTLATALGAVRADPGQIEQILMNLSVNARDAMPRGGCLTIQTQNVELDEDYVQSHVDARAGEYVLLSVTDSGTGIPPEVKARIFEPFFTTKGPGKGTGLGLATVYGIVKQSDGHLAVYSEMAVGTTFKIYLPRVERSEIESKSLIGREPAMGTETILVAEDEEGVRALARHVLSKYGYTVLVAEDGEEAIRVAAAHVGPIHLLISDVVMPGAGGRAVADELTERRSDLQVLYMSGYTDDAVIRHGVLREGVHFLQKPFSPDALAHKVREVLDAAEHLSH